MNLSFKTPKKPEHKARLALRNSKWKTALPIIEELTHAAEQNYAQWNLLGDVQYRSGDLHGASASWQRALDGYAQESLHENVLGIGRKMTKRCPEETSVHRSLSEAYLGLEYYADAISAFRSFIKLSKTATVTEKKAWFRKIMTYEITQPHLLEELMQLHDESGLEDIELQRDLQAYLERMHTQSEIREEVIETPDIGVVDVEETMTIESQNNGLASIESDWSQEGISFVQQVESSYDSRSASQRSSSQRETAPSSDYEIPEVSVESDLPVGHGKDHYDLGIVYAEMKLWDAAITEFQTARRDRSIRGKATIELANCLKHSNDPHRALRILEEETNSLDAESDAQDELNYHMGTLHEALGNASAAISCLEKVGVGTPHSDDAASRLTSLRAQ